MNTDMYSSLFSGRLRTKGFDRRRRLKALAMPVLLLAGVVADCAAGGITVCNKGTDSFFYTSIAMRGDGFDLSCELTGKQCHVDIIGWFELKSGKCDDLDIGARWVTYLGMYSYNEAGKLSPAKFKVKPKYFKNQEGGASGIEGAEICGVFETFRRRYDGTLMDVLNASSSCAAGDAKVQINLSVRTEPDVDFTLDLK